MKDIEKKLDTLSKMSRETSGAAFVIQHEKKTGRYKVTFSNSLTRSKARLKPTDFQQAIEDAIDFLEAEREELAVDYKYTLF